ncbi:restriction endonuclease subunit S [Sulfitobacter sp. R18_1]|uniref:restriction endonuclease subunit S n=1 Tax=Sulfitobacter sp. R18_1 TaxID=2821104 RepID=UPI001ADC9436|nr:restriction endonuclease subunit S [Sulfitobacter sp. R18_1]MBO9429642.1 restriction endonuclease subunit S [Sulfitobacter sp. R18_1]
MTTLDSLCAAIVDCEHKTAPKEEVGHPSIRTTDIKNGRIDFDNANRVSDPTYDAWTKRRRPMPGDLILAREAPVGEVGFIPEGVFPVLGQRTVLISPDHDKVSARYLHYLLISPSIQHEIQVRSSGSTVHHLNMKDIRELSLPQLPKRQVQDEIASLLGALDDKIELNRRMSATLEEMARSLYRSWFIDFDPVHAKMEGRQPAFLDEATAALFPDRFGEDGLPEGWRQNRLGNLLTLNYGKALKKAIRVAGPFSVYGSGGSDSTHEKALVTQPTIIVGRKGTVGNIFWEPNGCWPIDTTYYVTTDLPLVYVLHVLETLPLSEMNTDAAVPGLNRENAYRLEVPFPSTEIIAQFDASVGSIRTKMDLLKEQDQTLSALRDSLLPKLMSGELRVGDAREQIEEVA